MAAPAATSPGQVVAAEGGEEGIRRGDQDGVRLFGWLVGDLGAGRVRRTPKRPGRTVVAQFDPERRLGPLRCRHEEGADGQHRAVRAHEDLFRGRGAASAQVPSATTIGSRPRPHAVSS